MKRHNRTVLKNTNLFPILALALAFLLTAFPGGTALADGTEGEGPQSSARVEAGGRWIDVEDTQFADGPIALQYGAGVVKFRNVKIRRL